MDIIKIDVNATDQEIEEAVETALFQNIVLDRPYQPLMVEFTGKLNKKEEKKCDKPNCKVSESKHDANSFASALEAVQNGGMAYRKSWKTNGKHFIFSQIPTKLDMNSITTARSIPVEVQAEIFNRYLESETDSHDSLSFSNQMSMVHPNNEVYAWQPSNADLFATDWVVF